MGQPLVSAVDTLTVCELRLGEGAEPRYVPVAHVAGEGTWSARIPYEVSVTPARWLD